jgi:alpha-amylase
MVAEMGYKGMLTEGAKHILGWKSPNFLYANPINPRLKLLLRNYKLSDDIAFRFSNRSWSEYPLTTEKYAKWLNFIEKNEETVNIFMDYETFGEHQSRETGIFEFLKALPNAVFKNTRFSFSTPSEIFEALQPVAVMNVPYPISWADEERDLTAWLGNPLQEQAFNKLYDLLDRVRQVNDEVLQRDYNYLQVSDHFYYMCTKFFSDGEVHSYFNPYGTPYEAFINYMNVLSDFEIRLNAALKSDASDEVRRLSKIISQKDEQLKNLETFFR